MDKFVIRTKRPSISTVDSSTVKRESENIDGNFGDPSENVVRDVVVRDVTSEKRARLKSTWDGDVISDPGLRKPIDEYDALVKDDVRREYVLKGPCQPLSHDFPRSDFGNKPRRFQSDWFKQWAWLEYSVSKDAAFCFWCYLFKGDSLDSGKRFGNDVFVKTGFRNWKKGTEKFREHVGAAGSTHNDARRLFFAFKNQIQSLTKCVSSGKQVLGDEYRTRLAIVVDVLRFLLGQGLAFQEDNEGGKGNFLELLDLYCSRNTEAAKMLKDNAPSNEQLTSARIQREIASAFAAEITKALISEIEDKVFSLLIDVVCDHLRKEHIAIVVRYVNKHGEVVERFLGLVDVDDTDALSLKSGIDGFFAKHGLSISKLRGQGFDGASNMRKELNGLKTLILNENPCARYIHCFNHQLQSVIVAASYESLFVGKFLFHLSMFANVVVSPCKLKDEFLQKQHENTVEMLEIGETSNGRGLYQESTVRLGATRWGSHYTTIVRLLSLWSSTIEVLYNLDDDGRAGAASIAETMESYEFVFIAHFMKLVWGLTNVLSQFLQQKDHNIIEAASLIQSIKRKFRDLRENGWDELLGEVNSFCVKNDVVIPNMDDNAQGFFYRRVGHPVTNYQHFRVGIFCKVLDEIDQEMEHRFSEANTELLTYIACLDPKNSFSNFSESKLSQLVEFYPEDFSVCDRMELKDQLEAWIYEMRGNESFSKLQDIGALAKKMVEVGIDKAFHLVYHLIELVLVLPVVPAPVERVRFTVDIIEAENLCNRTGDASLNDCLVCYIERDVFKSINDEDILQHLSEHESSQDVFGGIDYYPNTSHGYGI